MSADVAAVAATSIGGRQGEAPRSLRSEPELYRLQCEVRRVAALHGVARAQLALVVGAPALHGAVIKQRASMVQTNADLARSAPSTERNGRQIGHFARLVTLALDVAEAQLTEQLAPQHFTLPSANTAQA